MEILEIILIYLILLLDIKLDFKTKNNNNNIKIEYNGLVWVVLGFLTNNRCKWFYLDISSKN